MAEKATAKKKDQQKPKKPKQNEKKKNQENGLKHTNEQSVHETNHVSNKKRDKNNRNNSRSANKKKPDSLLKRYFRLFFISTSCLFLVAGFLYLVDYEKYIVVREGAVTVLNKTLSLLPEEVVNKGRDILRPPAEAAIGRLNFVIKETSTFLNTNPLIKDHWANAKEIAAIGGNHLVEYLRTVYQHVTKYCHDTKAKIF